MGPKTKSYHFNNAIIHFQTIKVYMYTFSLNYYEPCSLQMVLVIKMWGLAQGLKQNVIFDQIITMAEIRSVVKDTEDI